LRYRTVTYGNVQYHAVSERVFGSWVLTRARMRLIFATLHRMQTRTSYEKSICLCPSIYLKHVVSDKTKQTYAQIFISYEKSFSLVL